MIQICPAVHVDAVAFDMDGVLIDTAAIHEGLWRRLFEEHLPRVKEIDIAALGGRRDDEVLAELLDCGPDLPEVAAACALLDGWYEEIVADHPPQLSPHARELVERLFDAGVPLALATGAPRYDVDRFLDPLLSFFAVIVTADDVQRGKPDPEIYLTAAAELGVRPAGCLAYEDSAAGIMAACAAGMQVIGVGPASSAPALIAAGALRVAGDLRAAAPAFF